MVNCPGVGWDRVNCLSSSWYSAMFWVQYEKNVEKTLMISVVAKQCLDQVKDFSASDAQPVRRLEGHKQFGGDTARTADPNWPKGYSILCDVMPSI